MDKILLFGGAGLYIDRDIPDGTIVKNNQTKKIEKTNDWQLQEAALSTNIKQTSEQTEKLMKNMTSSMLSGEPAVISERLIKRKIDKIL